MPDDLPLPEPGVAHDRSGQVTVAVDADGDLVEVAVGFSWDEALTAEELPAAVLAAVAGARGTRHEPSTRDSRRASARSSSGHAGATAREDGTVESLDLDPAWVVRAHPARLGQEITEAVRDATREARATAATGR